MFLNMLGGSVASSLTGVWRATQDIDLVVPLELNRVDEPDAERPTGSRLLT